jgi:tRNA modification GTPase TrmE
MYIDTIVAIATALSNSGIGIVRISGDKAFQIIDKIYKGKKKLSEEKSHTIHYGFIVDDEETIDEVLIMLYRGPRSYTGEDIVEINCHGGAYVVKCVLETVIKYGARPAEAGEFTKRAFLNGQIDLSKAEAVGDLIHAKNEYAHKNSISQLKGSVYRKIEEIRAKILYHTAFIESALDDPEHISVDGYGIILKEDIQKLLLEMKKLLASADNGRMLAEGIQTVILGKPNAGKSSLLNILSGRERAIVTEIAGTTRDVLEEQIRLDGLMLNIIDTAGIRETNDVVEKIGIDRAKEYAKNADLVLYVVDSSKQLDKNDKMIIEILKNKKAIILLNKIDLHQKVSKETILRLIKGEIIEISAIQETGIQELENVLKEMFFKGEISFNDEIYITNVRQKTAISNAKESLKRVCTSIDDGMPEDFYSIDLMDAYENLGNITGETVGEDLIHEIFSKFCMGK